MMGGRLAAAAPETKRPGGVFRTAAAGTEWAKGRTL